MSFDPVEHDLERHLAQLDDDEQERADEIAREREIEDDEDRREWEANQAEMERDRLF